MNLNIRLLIMKDFSYDVRYKIYSFSKFIDKKRTIKYL